MRELTSTTVRLDEETRKELERVANLGGVSPSDVVRMCVKYGLPIVEQGFSQMSELLETKMTETKKRKL